MTATPREAPVSLRLGKAREDRFKAFRADRKLPQSEALHTLLDAGLEKYGYPAEPKKPPKRERKRADPKRWEL